jgi:hypothetical protein
MWGKLDIVKYLIEEHQVDPHVKDEIVSAVSHRLVLNKKNFFYVLMSLLLVILS